MLEKISIIQYRKIKNIEFNFTKYINVISGTNGTCKTSLLYLISNSFQTVNSRNCPLLQDKKCLEIIKKINNTINPKIESLTRGDKQYNDPAIGHSGTLFTTHYFNHPTLAFRKHNSPESNRYSVKPYYPKGSHDKLPSCPVIYLGLSRLVPFGEYQNDNAIEGIKKSLPNEYQEEIMRLYEQLTGLSISSISPQKMGDIKIRSEFNSTHDGIDSNTISAGEDNLFIIITAIVSLKYYYENITGSSNSVESILLIDELDATLHPSAQIQLLELFHQYSSDYKIQFFFTTHSLSLLEYALLKKHNVVYLIDNITTVHKLDSPDIYKIKMFLESKTHTDIYTNRSIPLFMEDDEARIFLNTIFDYFCDKFPDKFPRVRRFFHLVDVKLGAENLINLFNDNHLLKSILQSICILDGDQNGKRELRKHIIILPGGKSPEELIMHYSIELFDNDDPFWTEPTILDLGFGKIYYRDKIRPDIDNITNTLEDLLKKKESTKGIKRELNKATFNKHKEFFQLLFKHWVNSNEHEEELDKFHTDLYHMFKKVAEFNGINPHEWNN
ncbi:AAA family ATPase [Desulfosporosinus sp. FKB]|uniref:ATP-dependent nuclease n=1 Tax=Desulfosporosinus sp. FKB TaxID=1969835 RepID=UPI000B4A1A77|nr:AAA family ATPase [Desulfosporosinus sp. FKB]